MWTDAATTVGGGYYIPLSDCADGSSGHFGQCLWSAEEKEIFGTADLESTDINILEFITVILAIVAEREILRGRVVRIHVDNTAAISWINKLKSKHEFGQLWVALVVTILLEYKITVLCIHIAGVANVTADDLSRYLQECRLRLLEEGYRQSTMPSTASRLAIWQGSSIEGEATRRLVQSWLTKQE